MWSVKWFSAFLCIVNIRCSMIVGNCRFRNRRICGHGSLFLRLRRHHSEIGLLCQCLFCSLIPSRRTVPETRSPLDLSNSIWHDPSSPYTEASDEIDSETTTHVHEPFFEENSTQINVTTQLGSDVYLHCRVNDLREKMVSRDCFCLSFPPSLRHESTRRVRKSDLNGRKEKKNW
jgi:hypothetical protein